MTAYVWRDSSVRGTAHAYETEFGAVVDDVAACGVGSLAASLDGEARHPQCQWCAPIAAHAQREAERRAADAAYERQARLKRQAKAGKARRQGVVL